MKSRFSQKGQSTFEYAIILAAILFAVLNAGFIDRARNVFSNYFDDVVNVITPLP